MIALVVSTVVVVAAAATRVGMLAVDWVRAAMYEAGTEQGQATTPAPQPVLGAHRDLVDLGLTLVIYAAAAMAAASALGMAWRSL